METGLEAGISGLSLLRSTGSNGDVICNVVILRGVRLQRAQSFYVGFFLSQHPLETGPMTFDLQV